MGNLIELDPLELDQRYAVYSGRNTLEDGLIYETTKEKLFVKLCCPETSQDFLHSVPHTRIQDMEATYHLMLPSGKNGISSRIKRQLTGKRRLAVSSISWKMKKRRKARVMHTGSKSATFRRWQAV